MAPLWAVSCWGLAFPPALFSCPFFVSPVVVFLVLVFCLPALARPISFCLLVACLPAARPPVCPSAFCVVVWSFVPPCLVRLSPRFVFLPLRRRAPRSCQPRRWPGLLGVARSLGPGPRAVSSFLCLVAPPPVLSAPPPPVCIPNVSLVPSVLFRSLCVWQLLEPSPLANAACRGLLNA